MYFPVHKLRQLKCTSCEIEEMKTKTTKLLPLVNLHIKSHINIIYYKFPHTPTLNLTVVSETGYIVF